MAVVRGAFISHGWELFEALSRGRKGHDMRTHRLSPVRPGIAGAKRSPFPPCFRLGVSRTMVVTDPGPITHEACARVHNVCLACLPGGTSKRPLGQ